MEDLQTVEHHADGAPQADNPGQSIVLPGQTPQGEHILAVLLKRSYDIVPEGMCSRAEKDTRLVSGDQHYEDPMNSSVEFESDFVPYKVATDVVFNGSAHAPDGVAVQTLSTSLCVGNFVKQIRIIGDRVCHHRPKGPPLFSEPIPFTSMPIRYENAYGGIDIYSDPTMQCVYPRNHLGKGYVIGKDKKQIDQLALPNIEDPNDALTPEKLCLEHFMHWEKAPMPQGFGWVCKFWRPRGDLAGVLPADRAFEQELRQVFSQAVPEDQRELYDQTQLPDMDFRFFNGASAGLVLPFLQGGELIRLVNLSPQGELSFALPADHPQIGLDIGKGLQASTPVLHTVLIRMQDNQVDLVWRAAVSYPGPDWLPQMKKMEVMIQ